MKRSKYMQEIMTATYPQVALKAIQTGNFDTAWIDCIVDAFKKVANTGNDDFIQLIGSLTRKAGHSLTFQEAAQMILDSEVENEPKIAGGELITADEENEVLHDIIGGIKYQ